MVGFYINKSDGCNKIPLNDNLRITFRGLFPKNSEQEDEFLMENHNDSPVPHRGFAGLLFGLLRSAVFNVKEICKPDLNKRKSSKGFTSAANEPCGLSGRQYRQLHSLLNDPYIQKLIDNDYIANRDLEFFAYLDKDSFKQLNTLLSDTNIQKLLESQHITPILLCDAARLNENSFKRFEDLVKNDDVQKMLENGRNDATNLILAANLDEAHYKNFNCLLQNSDIKDLIQNDKIFASDIGELALLDETQHRRLNSLLKNDDIQSLLNKDKNNAGFLNDFARYDEVQYAQLNSLLKNPDIQGFLQDGKINVSILNDFARCDQVQFKHLNSLLPVCAANPEALKLIAEKAAKNEDLEPLIEHSEKLSKKISYEQILNLLELHKYLDTKDVLSLSPIQKIKIIELIKFVKSMFDIKDLFNKEEQQKISDLDERITRSLKYAITPVQVSLSDISEMMSGFFTDSEQSVKEILTSTDFTRFEKQGLPLEYSRKEFLDDLTSEFALLSEDEQNKITDKMEILPVKDSDGNIIGYDGIINLLKLSNSGAEGKILSLAQKFIKDNRVLTGECRTDRAMNALIGGMPEFINIIGKKQQNSQTPSSDIHALTLLQNAMKDTNFQSLSNKDKMCLKFAAIFLDIAKSENYEDKTQSDISALYARNIMEKYPFSESMKDRIFEIVREYGYFISNDRENVSVSHIASSFRRKNDYAIAKIIAKADSANAARDVSNPAKSDEQKQITNELETINSTGQLIFTSKIVKDSLIPVVRYNDREYKVIDFTKMTRGENLSKYGFAPDVTYDSARFFVHMTDDSSDMETVEALSNATYGGFLCASYISLNNKNSFFNKKIGVSLECDNVNIANAANHDQNSGFEKDFDLFGKIITGQDFKLSGYRKSFSDIIKSALNLNDKEYSEFYEVFAHKKYLTQIKDDDEYSTADKTLCGADIKKAIQCAQEYLFRETGYNEINLYNPKINALAAKVNSIDEIPTDFLDFAYKYRLPIYILGSAEKSTLPV